MAKNPKNTDQNGKVKFRIIEFEMEGGDETLQESLKSIAIALMRTNPSPAAKGVRNDGPRQISGVASAEPAQDEVVDAEEEDESDVSVEPVRRVSAPRKTKIAPVKILSDIRLDDVTPPLKEFCLEKAPSTDLARYLVIAYWFKNHKNLPDLTPDHFYTAYRLLSWNTPRDPAQPIRDLRHTRRGKFSPGQTPGTSQINHIGENAVNEMTVKH